MKTFIIAVALGTGLFTAQAANAQSTSATTTKKATISATTSAAQPTATAAVKDHHKGQRHKEGTMHKTKAGRKAREHGVKQEKGTTPAPQPATGREEGLKKPMPKEGAVKSPAPVPTKAPAPKK